MKQIIQASLRDWSFYLYGVLLVLGNGYLALGSPMYKNLKNPSPQSISTHFMIVIGVMIAYTVLFTLACFRIRGSFADNHSGSFGGLLWGYIVHALKTFLVMMPVILVIEIAVFATFGFEKTASFAKEPLRVWLFMMPLMFIFMVWGVAGFSVVLAQLNSKHSIRASFKVLFKRLKPILLFGVIYIVLASIPYLVPGGPMEKISQAAWGNSGNLNSEMQTLLKPDISPVYLLMFAVVMFTNLAAVLMSVLYVAKTLMGTTLLYQGGENT